MFNFKITEDQSVETMQKGLRVENVPYLLLLLTVFLLPIIFLPQSVSSLLATKMFTLHVLVLVSFFIWILMKLRTQSINLPFNLSGLSIVLIPAIYVLAAVFSKNIHLSFFGRDFAVDSVLSILTFTALLTLTISNLKEKSQVIYLYAVLFLSFIIVAIVQLLNLIPIFPSFGYFSNNVITTIGKWNELAVFALIIVVLSITMVHFIRLTKAVRAVVYGSTVVGLVLLVIINFKIAWYILALFTLFLFVYLIVGKRKDGHGTTIPFTPLVVFLISFLFIVAGTNIGNVVSDTLNINHFEVRPSWKSTTEIIGQTWSSKRAILGVGPALFETEWIMNRPSRVLTTDFWNLDFRYGVGLIPSYFSTTGILGALSWIFFLGLILFYGFKSVFREYEDGIQKYIIFSSFSVTTILWVINIIYLPGTFLIATTFVFTGIFINSLYRINLLQFKDLKVDTEPKFNFIFIAVLVILLASTIGLVYKATNKFVAQIHFQRAIVDLNVQGNIALAESDLRKALELENNDIYLRSLAELGTIRITQILGDTVTPQDLLVDQFRNVLSGTISNYQDAIAFDETNYNNYLGLAELYRALGPLKISGSYDQAVVFYNRVSELKPNNPDVLLRNARLEFEHGDSEKAKDLISQALQIKPNYVDAVFLYSQIEVTAGNIGSAIEAIQSASVIKPNDPTIFFQLGLLYYNDSQFARAVASFERAVALNPNFQNAKYFLGLSYQKTNRIQESISQFDDLVKLNSDNDEVKLILSNLKAGRAPFVGAEPPIDNQPESREDLPLNDGELTTDEGEE
ncbi:tetratricopeptide repeat protein [Candidatus Nomurabacteria bacterium]|nr:tetratricopeptide repeat protein [Candidatus Nomurabacteria bacterium]